jgi:hypothetical protein
MNDTPTDSNAALRRSIYWVLIALSAGAMLGRIFAIDSVDLLAVQRDRLAKMPGELEQKRQSLEAKGISGDELRQELDRAEKRLRTRAAVGRPFLSANDRSRWCSVRALVEDDMRVEGAPYAIDKVIKQRGWDTIDMVYHDGHYYSSKPPLLATLMAAAYWPIYRLGGVSLATHPYEIGRFMLVLFNVVPLVIGLALLGSLIERFGTTDWGRIFVMAAAAFGTFLTTFAVAINNHLPAAVCTAVTLYAVVRLWFDGERRWRFFIVAGLFAGLAAGNDLPATSLLAAVSLVLLLKAPKPTLLAFAPAVVVVAAAFFGTNWISHGTLAPAYAHGSGKDNWYDYTIERDGQKIDSHWRHPTGLDAGEPSRAVYAFNVLVGHHGVFSLTPVWLLSFAGMGVWLFHRGDPRLRWWAAATIGISLVVLAFYLFFQSLTARNYGGNTSGFRWVFWLAPLWLLAMLPTADLLARRRWTRGLGLVLLALSVLSANYPTWNPWVHPWLMNLSQYLGWGV